MEIEYIEDTGLNYLLIKNTYDNFELEKIKNEIVDLYKNAQEPNELVQVAKDDDGTYKKNCKSIFLDEHYDTQRYLSNILTFNRKLFSADIYKLAIEKNILYKHILCSSRDSTLINYYRSGEKYKIHRDNCIYTAITFYDLGVVSGGGLIFPEYNHKVNFEENTTVIFPSCLDHTTEDIITKEDGFRVSVTQFISYIKYN